MALRQSGIGCYLGLGSNLNQPVKQIRTCIKHLAQLPNTQVIATSNLYRSKAWGVTEQNDFVNAVVKVQTSLTPMLLLKLIKTIEYRLMRRQANLRWHSRVIDIDILLYDHSNVQRKELTVPHPWISERCFVIKPLLELKPKLPATLFKKLEQHSNNHQCTDQLIKIKHPNTMNLKVFKSR